jgi:hypothetical protein
VPEPIATLTVPVRDEDGVRTGATRTVSLFDEDGSVRLVLGGLDDPDFWVEAAPWGWRVLLHPEDGADPVLTLRLRKDRVELSDGADNELCPPVEYNL